MKSTWIVIPTHNRWKRLKCLLDEINKQSQNYSEINVVVVADGCTDGTLENLQNDSPDIDVIKGDGSWWFTRSLNEGINYAMKFSPDFILTLNDDVEIKYDYLSHLFKAAEIKNGLCLIGSISYTVEEPHLLTFSGIQSTIKWRLKNQRYHKYKAKNLYGTLKGIQKSVVMPTRGLLIPSRIFMKGLYFDESLPQYSSDFDFVLKARKKGYESFISWDAIIFEYTGITGEGNPVMCESFYKFHKNLFNKHAMNYVPKDIKMILRHNMTLLLPLTLLIYVLGLYWTYFKYNWLNRNEK